MSLLLTVTLRVTVWQEGAGGRERLGALPGAEVIGRAATAPPPPGRARAAPAGERAELGPPAPARQRAPARRDAGVNGLALARPAPAPSRAPPSGPLSRSPRARCSHARPRPAPACKRERARLQRTGPGGQPYWLSDCPNLRLRREEGGGDSAAGAGQERGGGRGLGGPRGAGGPLSRPRANSGRTLAGARSQAPLCAPALRARLDGGRARTHSPAPAGQGLVARAAEQTFGRGWAQV